MKPSAIAGGQDNRSVNFKDLTKNTRVVAPLGDQMHRGIIVEPPDDHPQRNCMIGAKFTPPVRAGKPNTAVTHITFEADCVALGWSDE
jgi:hypothetical protein